MEKTAICGFCNRGTEVAKICGHLYVTESVAAHKKCMQYSARLVQYHHNIGFGGFKLEKVQEEIIRGRKLRCSLCTKKLKRSDVKQTRGATAGCSWMHCIRSFHFYCAAVSDTVITRRIEVINSKKQKVVEYRIFCGEKHEKLYLESKLKEKHHMRTKSEESGSSGTEFEGESIITPKALNEDFNTSSCTSDDDDLKEELVKKQLRHRRSKQKRARDMDDGTISYDSETEAHACKRSKTDDDDDDELSTNSSPVYLEPDEQEANVQDKTTKLRSAERPSTSDQDQMNSVNNSMVNPIGTLTPLRPVKQERQNEDHVDNQKHLSLVHEEESRDSLNCLELDLNKKTDCLLCFAEMADIPVAFEKRLKRYIQRTYNIPGDSVCLWSHRMFKLSAEHIVYLLKDLSLSLRQQHFDQFQRQVLNLKEEDINKYSYIIEFNQSYPEDLARTLYTKLRDSVKENLQVACDQLKRSIGMYCRVQYKNEHIRIAFLVLNDETDPGRKIRKAMHKKPSVYHWDNNTKAQIYSMNPTDETKQREFSILKHCLETVKGPFVDVRPWDPIMASNQNESITNQLLKHFQRATTFSDVKIRFIFLRPLDESIVVYSGYLQKLLSSLFHDEMEQTNFVVFDLQPDLETAEEILAGLPDGVNSKVISAWNPAHDAVTCIVLKLTRAKANDDDACGSRQAENVMPVGKNNGLDSSHRAWSRQLDDIKMDDEEGYIDMCQIIREDPPTETISFTPPDIKWRLLQCNKLGLKMVKISPANAILETRTIGIPSLTQKVRGDGNCFFRALSQEITGTQNQYAYVRKKLITYMVKNSKIFEKYFNMHSIQNYITESGMAKNGTWATDTEIIAMATMLDTKIVIFTKVGTCYKWLPYGPLGGTSSHTCQVYLVNKGHHYDLVLDVQAESSRAEVMA